jgi:hypothetical protein
LDPSLSGTNAPERRLYGHGWNYDTTANRFGWTTASQVKLLLGN